MKETFTYDLQNRLTEVRLGSVQTGTSAYDGYGRMTSKTADGQAVFSNAVYSTTAKPHAMDAAETLSGVFPSQQQNISYTCFDKVSQIMQGNKSLNYTYGYDHQRIFMEEHIGANVRTKRYVGNCEYVTETSGNTTTQKWLTCLTGPTGVYAVVVTENNANTIHYILKDNLGSWATITNGNGAVEQSLSYDALEYNVIISNVFDNKKQSFSNSQVKISVIGLSSHTPIIDGDVFASAKASLYVDDVLINTQPLIIDQQIAVINPINVSYIGSASFIIPSSGKIILEIHGGWRVNTGIGWVVPSTTIFGPTINANKTIEINP